MADENQKKVKKVADAVTAAGTKAVKAQDPMANELNARHEMDAIGLKALGMDAPAPQTPYAIPGSTAADRTNPKAKFGSKPGEQRIDVNDMLKPLAGDVSHHAAGGELDPYGVNIVGEDGPEAIVGNEVVPAPDTEAILGKIPMERRESPDNILGTVGAPAEKRVFGPQVDPNDAANSAPSTDSILGTVGKKSQSSGDSILGAVGAPAMPKYSGTETALYQNRLKNLDDKKEKAVDENDHSAYLLADLAERDLKSKHPYGSPDNHPGILGKIGHTLGRIGNIAGDVLAPGTMALIPGTDLNNKATTEGESDQLRQIAGERAENKLKTAQASAVGGKTPNEQVYRALMTGNNGQPKVNPDTNQPFTEQEALQASMGVGKTPEEITLHDLMTGQNGQPRVNPNTNAPYTYGEAFEHVKELGQKESQQNQPIGNVENLQSDLLGRYQVMHPEATELPARYQIPANANSADYTRLDKAMEQEEKAHQGHEQNQEARNDRISQQDTARLDRVYQASATSLDKMEAPISQLSSRMGRLQDTLAQNSPQADALVAPELLTVMSGGQGSGLRMTEAEISRIIGGRSKWEDLKAAANKWSADPSKANSITTEQRKEIRALVGAVNEKLVKKQQILDDAHTALLNSDSVEQHRAVVAHTKQQLTKVDVPQEEKEQKSSQSSGAKATPAKKWNPLTGRYE